MKPKVKYMKSLADILPRKRFATSQSWSRSFCCSSSLISLLLYIILYYITFRQWYIALYYTYQVI